MSDAARRDAAPILGVLVPCRDEARVLTRKLGNLARLRWPDARAPHHVVVVDDHSADDTGALAARLLASLALPAAVGARVVANPGRPGKTRAVAAGLDALRGAVDVIVLTDADVVLEDDALLAVAAAFARDDALGMACGSQRFVADLAADGRPSGADGAPPVPAPGRYDRWTARVRALESRTGRLFSVHGQLLAWRASLDITPTPGLAADDLDLMLAVRARGRTVRLLDDARFLEMKTPPGDAAEAQALRRARAYVQFVRRASWPAPASLDPWTRAQFAAYRRIPLAAPWIALIGVIAVLGACAFLAGTQGALACAALLAALCALPAVRRLVRLLAVIARATRAESRADLGDRWEMARP